MAKKVEIAWYVFDKATNMKVEGVSHAAIVDALTDIQPKCLEKLSANYQCKELESDLKIQDKISEAGDRGGYFITEFTDDSKTHDIIIIVIMLQH